jgi:hypothetical protein
MASQEEWRQIAYQRSVGEQGNNSIGTIHNQQGYQTYLDRNRQNNVSLSSSVSSPETGGYVGGEYSGDGRGSGSTSFQFVDHFFDSIPGWVRWVALGISFMAGFGYAIDLGHSGGEAALWGGGAMAALAFAYALLIVAIKLVLALVYLAAVGAIAYGGYWAYISFL